MSQNDWPLIWVLFVTYNRTEAALRTARGLKEYLWYPKIHWHICDDGSREEHITALLEIFGEGATWHTREREGPQDFDVGGNINKGMKRAWEAGANIHLMNLDDFAPVENVDLRPAVDVLDIHSNVGFVRLGYHSWGLSGTVTNYHAPRLGADYMWFRLIRDWSMNNEWQTDSYLISMQPYVAHQRFFGTHGMYPEKLHPGATEVEMNRLYIEHPDKEKTPQILSLMGKRMTDTPYRHIARRHKDYREACGNISLPHYIDTPIIDGE